MSDWGKPLAEALQFLFRAVVALIVVVVLLIIVIIVLLVKLV